MEICKMFSQANKEIKIDDIQPEYFDYNKVGKRTKHYIVVHDMITDIPYHQIKQNPNIFKALQQNNCFLQLHLWKREIWNIITIGFLSGISPKHQTKDTTMTNINAGKENVPEYEIRATKMKLTMYGTEYNIFVVDKNEVLVNQLCVG